MRVLAGADVHGCQEVAQWLVEVARGQRAEVIVLAGDLLRASEGFHTEEDAQRHCAKELAGIFKQAGVPILYVMGNDDLVEWQPAVDGFASLHGRRVTLEGFHFVGYQYSLPFAGGPFEKPEDQIRADLDALEQLVDSGTILVTHSPAYGILDLGVLDQHAGSRSILAVVRKHNILAHIHGHIHRCFGRDGLHFNVASAGKKRAMLLEVPSLQHEFLRP